MRCAADAEDEDEVVGEPRTEPKRLPNPESSVLLFEPSPSELSESLGLDEDEEFEVAGPLPPTSDVGEADVLVDDTLCVDVVLDAVV